MAASLLWISQLSDVHLARQHSRKRLPFFCLGAPATPPQPCEARCQFQKVWPSARRCALGLARLDRESRESREDCVRKDLTGRLKRVCENLSSEDFEALVMKMTREQLRGEGVGQGILRPLLRRAANREARQVLKLAIFP